MAATTPSIPVFCRGQLAGFLALALPNWQGIEDTGTPTLYRLAEGPAGGTGPRPTAVPIVLRTVFDSLKRAIALEIEDPTPLETRPEFRYVHERDGKALG